MRSQFTNAFLLASAVVAFWFLNHFAFQYLHVDRDRYGIYWDRQEWLYVHIIAGALALLLGPLQFWLGLNRREIFVHRIIGAAYLLCAVVSATAGLYLARHTDFGWIFGMGMTAMSMAWIVATSFATIAICLHVIEQHREWMIRSYVLTFGFVTFRMVTGSLHVAGVGTTQEQMIAASWFSWAVPLLITECLIQGRKVLSSWQQSRVREVERSASPTGRNLNRIAGLVSSAKTLRQPVVTDLQLTSLLSPAPRFSDPTEATESQGSHEAQEEHSPVAVHHIPLDRSLVNSLLPSSVEEGSFRASTVRTDNAERTGSGVD